MQPRIAVFSPLHGYDDSPKKHAMEFNSNHGATAYAGAYLIHWWSYLFARTGDEECLRWGDAMARKWQSAQHPETGLAPAWFDSDRTDEDTMPPRPFGNHWDNGTAVDG